MFKTVLELRKQSNTIPKLAYYVHVRSKTEITLYFASCSRIDPEMFFFLSKIFYKKIGLDFALRRI